MLHWEYCHYYNLIRYSYYNNNQLIEDDKSGYYIECLYKYFIPKQNDTFEIKYFSHIVDEYEQNNYDRINIPLVWEKAIDEYIEKNGEISSIAEENILFNEFISNLPQQPLAINGNSYYTNFRWYSPLYYQDYNIFLDEDRNQIPNSSINPDGTYNIEDYEYIDGDYTTIIIKKPLPSPIYWVN